MIHDGQIDWVRKRAYYDYWALRCLIIRAINEGSTGNYAEGEAIHGAADAAGNARLFEIGTSGLVGLKFIAAGDFVRGFIRMPYDFDPRYELGLRVNWTNSAAAAAGRGVTWLIAYLSFMTGNINDLSDLTYTNLNPAIAESLITGAWANEWTARRVIEASALGFSLDEIDDHAQLGLYIEPDVIDASVADVCLLGIEIDYVPRKCLGPGAHTDKPVNHAAG